MGRIRTKLIKRITHRVIAEYHDVLKKDYDENKVVLSELARIPSKKLRNVLAGSVTRAMKHE